MKSLQIEKCIKIVDPKVQSNVIELHTNSSQTMTNEKGKAFKSKRELKFQSIKPQLQVSSRSYEKDPVILCLKSD